MRLRRALANLKISMANCSGNNALHSLFFFVWLNYGSILTTPNLKFQLLLVLKNILIGSLIGFVLYAAYFYFTRFLISDKIERLDAYFLQEGVPDEDDEQAVLL